MINRITKRTYDYEILKPASNAGTKFLSEIFHGVEMFLYRGTHKNIHYLFNTIPDQYFQKQFIQRSKQHTFESFHHTKLSAWN